MEFYESIAEYYDLIFDPEDSAEIIHEKYLDGGPKDVIDIGCAAGKLSAGIAALGHRVTGIDLDAGMVALAAGRYSKNPGVIFKCVNMLDVAKVFGEESFDAAMCVGNTIVHLDGYGGILSFFRALHSALRPGGIFAAQILNYDRILAKGIDRLALIENDRIKFERYYDLDRAKFGGKINFRTRLTVKATGRVIDNEVLLYPAGKSEIEGALEAAGFGGARFHSDIDGTPFDIETSGPLAFEAKK